MQSSWVRLLARYDIAPAAAYPIFDRLVAAHDEPQRHYHTLEHVGEVLRVAARLSEPATDLTALSLAIWFHDAVYDPRARDNEEQSAQFASNSLRTFGIGVATLDRIAAMIRATAHTSASDVDGDTAILLDADLAILSAEERRYARYADDIAREYSWVEPALYRAGGGP